MTNNSKPYYTTTPQKKQTLESLWRLEKIILNTLDFEKVAQKIVNGVFTECGYLKLGYKIIVLALVDEKKNLKRVSISQTPEAEKVSKKALALTIPFPQIITPLSAKDNLCIKVLSEKKPAATNYWPDILCPPFSKEQAVALQKQIEIKTSLVYPIISQNKSLGVLIFSMTKEESEVSLQERDLIAGFTDVVGLAVQNAKLYTFLKEESQKASKVSSELAEVNKQVYKRNWELAVRNRTLSVLRRIYEIINTSLGISETAQKLTDAMVEELQFQNGFIALIDNKENMLKTTAVALSETNRHGNSNFSSFLKTLNLPLSAQENFCVDSIIQQRQRMSNSLFDILTPVFNQEKADKIQSALKTQTVIIYPIIFAGRPLGVLVLGLAKHIGFMAQSDLETLKEVIEVVAIAIERAQIYADLKVANQKLKELDVLKDEFVSVASHELRTPMTAIKSYLWLVLYGKENLSEKLRRYIDRAYISSNRLIKLVNDMLNVSRIESGRMMFDIKEVKLDSLVQDTIAEIAPKVDELGIKIILENYPNLPSVLADSDKIKEVLINLLSNSLKFTPKGGKITISFKIAGDIVETCVADMGEGIEQEDIPKLFHKFGLVQGSYITNQKAAQGTGLGLYISKSIIDFHQGKISVSSEGKGKGATFCFSLKIFNPKDLEKFQAEKKGEEGLSIIHSGL